MQQLRNFGLAMLAGSLLVGCSTMGSGMDEKQVAAIQMCQQKLPVSDKIKLQSVSMGCVASMAFYKAIGSNNPAPMLCMAGGASGFLFGESIAERKCAYITQEDQLKGEIAHAKKMNTGFAIVFAQQSQELAAFELMVAGLRGQQADAAARREQMTKLESGLADQMANDQAMLKQVNDEFRFKQKTLVESKSLQKQDQEDALLAEIRALQKNVKQLQENNVKFAKLKQSLVPSG